MKNIAILSFVLVLVVAGVANSATTTVTYQVSASGDDGFAQSAAVQDTTSAFLKIGDERTYAVPYQMSGMRFNNVNIPRSATITSAYLKISSINTDYRGQIYGVIAAEASDNPADFSSRMIGDAALTAASVVWDYKTAWSPDTQYISPDISNAIQEVVNRAGFGSGNSIAIYYSTRALSGKARSFASYEYSPASAAVLEVTYETYTISGHVTIAGGGGLEGVTVSAGSDIEGDVTDATGYYEIKVPPGWSGTVTPNKTDWGFSPAMQTYNDVTSDQINQDYTAFQPVISGYVRDGSGVGVADVNVTADNGGGSDTTDSSGYYEITVPYDWSGVVTAKRAAWQITPVSYSYNNLTGDESNQDFTAIYVGIIVKPDGTGDFATIQAAIDEAVNGDVVVLQPGTFTGDGNRDIDFLGKAITVRGATGDPNDCIIDCQADPNNLHRGFKFVSGEDTNSILDGVTIINGNGPVEAFFVPGSGTWLYGPAGAILCKNSGPFIINCIISSNTAYNFAGGIYNYESNTVIKNCIFNSNFTSGTGGAVYNEYSNVTLTDCSFVANSTYQPGGGISNRDSIVDINNCRFNSNVAGLCGGGIYNQGSNVSIRNCSFNNNSMTESSRGGGGVANSFGSIVTITDCTFIDNEGYDGGGIWNNRSSIKLKGCEFIGNTGRKDGGGLYIEVSDLPSVDNCSFIDNTATSGGGILNYYSDLKLSNSYFSNNTASIHGGGMFSRNLSNPILKNCTFTCNSASFGGGLKSDGGSNTEIKIKDCIVWGNSPDQIHNYGAINISYSDIQGGWEGVGNIDADPLFAGDGYHLSGISPCIDSGDPNYIPDINETDIDGDPRVIVRIDMGADEVYSGTSALIVIMPEMVNFTAEGLNSASQSQNVSIKNYGAGVLNWQISGPNDCNWLSAFPVTGQLNTGESNEVEITINPNIAGYGTHSCQLQVTAPGAENSPQTVTVNLEVLGPFISIDPNKFDITVCGKTGDVNDILFSIFNAGYDTLNWQIEVPDCNWLTVSPLSGQSANEPNIVTIAVDTNFVEYGQQSCQLIVTADDANNSPQIVTVNLEVLRPQIGVNKTNFYFTAYGKSDTSVAGQELIITNTGYDTLNWHIEVPDCNWLSIAPQGGQVTDGNSIVALTVDPNKAPAYGYNYATINIVDENASNSPRTVTLRLQVLGPSMYVNPPSLYIYAESDTMVEETFEIINTGYDILHWNIETPNDCNWLEIVEPLSGECVHDESKEITVTIDTSGLENNDYHTELLIHSPEMPSRFYFLSLIVYTPNEIHVPRDYPTIQAAINTALTGDVIIVHPGKYEGFRVDKPALTIQSIEPENPAVVAATIIESMGYVYGSETVIDGLSFIYNPAIYVQSDGIYISYNAQIKNCRILNFPGAGINVSGRSQYPEATITNCVISNNGYIGGYACGGIRVNASAHIENCLITGNFGGGISAGGPQEQGSTFYIYNSTIADNFSDIIRTAGRGITCDYSYFGLTLSLRNSVVSNAVGPNDVEILINADNPDNINLEIEYSNVTGGSTAVSVPNDVNFVWGQGNIDADPCFAEAGFWHPNDTPLDANDDFWVQGDYHLKSQAGRWKPSIYIGLDPTGDGFIDLSDFAALASFWCEKGGSLPADLDNSGFVDFADLFLLLDNYLTNYSSGAWVLDDVNSPCIDAGDPVSDWTEELWPHGKHINMGAYGGTPQASMSLLTVGNKADLNNDGFVNAEDLALFVEMWLVDDLLLAENINRNGLVNSPDFAEFAGQWLWEE